ncbi:MAG: alpha-hydroxy-acid oxidizing protein, partial [Leptospiraceae bacterium]|nr:alpha-hydroxy-acid oxidizing protein [Leptospiraceae bacterium]
NHGGRVLDDMPGTADVLPGIVRQVKGRIPVLVDGGIRSGRDVFKMLAFGANAVLVGRMVAIAAVGGEDSAIRFLLHRYNRELNETMRLCGVGTIPEIKPDFIFHDGLPDMNESVKD